MESSSYAYISITNIISLLTTIPAHYCRITEDRFLTEDLEI